MSYDRLFEFEKALSEYTGAPYVVVTDGCTHAIELCLRYDCPEKPIGITPYTYISVVQVLQNLYLEYYFLEHKWQRWIGEYPLINSRVWDSARRLERNMYRPNTLQCLSFGNGKPLQLGRVGAILTDDAAAYRELSCMRSDGRDLRTTPWQNQKEYRQGFHYCPTLEDCSRGIDLLEFIDERPKYYEYPDLRKINFTDPIIEEMRTNSIKRNIKNDHKH